MGMHVVDTYANELGRVQCGCFARWQLKPRGITQDVLTRRVRSGRWVRHAPGVYGLPSHPDSHEQRLWIAWLTVGPDAVVSHEAAAELHGLAGSARGRIVLTAPHPTHARIEGGFVHQISDVLATHRVGVRGLPTTTVARTVVDLAAWVTPERLRHLLESARHDLHVGYDEIGLVLADVARRGKAGCGRLANALDALNGHGDIEGGILQRLLLRALKDHGLPPPVLPGRHPALSLPGGCFAVAYPEARLIVEADGRRWHTRIDDLQVDRDRDASAARSGWQVVRLLHEHLVGDPDGSALVVGDLLARRRDEQAAS